MNLRSTLYTCKIGVETAACVVALIGFVAYFSLLFAGKFTMLSIGDLRKVIKRAIKKDK